MKQLQRKFAFLIYLSPWIDIIEEVGFLKPLEFQLDELEKWFDPALEELINKELIPAIKK
jgi:hypothetical protein